MKSSPLPPRRDPPPLGDRRAATPWSRLSGRTALGAIPLLILLAASPSHAQKRPAANPKPRGVTTVAAAQARPTPTPPPPPAPEPTPSTAPENQVTETEIVATDGAEFDSKGRIATFNKDVHVTDPRFELHCDKLTVFLVKTTEKGAARPAPTPTPAPAATGIAGGKSDDPNATGGIERAVAEGHVVIVQHRAPETPGGPDKTSTGQGEKAVFVTKTGEMTLTGSPRVQQDINEHVATAPGTIMVLGRDNTLKTFGPSKTLIRQRPNEKPPGAPGAPSPRPGGAARG